MHREITNESIEIVDEFLNRFISKSMAATSLFKRFKCASTALKTVESILTKNAFGLRQDRDDIHRRHRFLHSRMWHNLILRESVGLCSQELFAL